MNKKYFSIIIFTVLFCLGGVALTVNAQLENPIKYNDFSSLLTNGILPAVSAVIGSISIIMIIVAGIFYLTSAGSPERIGVAKKALIYALVGLTIALAAESIAGAIKSAIGA